MCHKNIKDREYIYEFEAFFCVECMYHLKKNNVCHVCMNPNNKSPNNNSKWIECSHCGKWIH